MLPRPWQRPLQLVFSQRRTGHLQSVELSSGLRSNLITSWDAEFRCWKVELLLLSRLGWWIFDDCGFDVNIVKKAQFETCCVLDQCIESYRSERPGSE